MTRMINRALRTIRGSGAERRSPATPDLSDPDLIDAEADLVRALSESARDEQGERHCAKCGRQLPEQGFRVSLMGRGVSCSDVAGCTTELERMMKGGGDHRTACYLCHTERTIIELSIVPRLHDVMLRCRDTDECQRVQDERNELFRRLR